MLCHPLQPACPRLFLRLCPGACCHFSRARKAGPNQIEPAHRGAKRAPEMSRGESHAAVHLNRGRQRAFGLSGGREFGAAWRAPKAAREREGKSSMSSRAQDAPDLKGPKSAWARASEMPLVWSTQNAPDLEPPKRCPSRPPKDPTTSAAQNPLRESARGGFKFRSPNFSSFRFFPSATPGRGRNCGCPGGAGTTGS